MKLGPVKSFHLELSADLTAVLIIELDSITETDCTAGIDIEINGVGIDIVSSIRQRQHPRLSVRLISTWDGDYFRILRSGVIARFFIELSYGPGKCELMGSESNHV